MSEEKDSQETVTPEPYSPALSTSIARRQESPTIREHDRSPDGMQGSEETLTDPKPPKNAQPASAQGTLSSVNSSYSSGAEAGVQSVFSKEGGPRFVMPPPGKLSEAYRELVIKHAEVSGEHQLLEQANYSLSMDNGQLKEDLRLAKESRAATEQDYKKLKLRTDNSDERVHVLEEEINRVRAHNKTLTSDLSRAESSEEKLNALNDHLMMVLDQQNGMQPDRTGKSARASDPSASGSSSTPINEHAECYLRLMVKEEEIKRLLQELEETCSATIKARRSQAEFEDYLFELDRQRSEQGSVDAPDSNIFMSAESHLPPGFESLEEDDEPPLQRLSDELEESMRDEDGAYANGAREVLPSDEDEAHEHAPYEVHPNVNIDPPQAQSPQLYYNSGLSSIAYTAPAKDDGGADLETLSSMTYSPQQSAHTLPASDQGSSFAITSKTSAQGAGVKSSKQSEDVGDTGDSSNSQDIARDDVAPEQPRDDVLQRDRMSTTSSSISEVDLNDSTVGLAVPRSSTGQLFPNPFRAEPTNRSTPTTSKGLHPAADSQTGNLQPSSIKAQVRERVHTGSHRRREPESSEISPRTHAVPAPRVLRLGKSTDRKLEQVSAKQAAASTPDGSIPLRPTNPSATNQTKLVHTKSMQTARRRIAPHQLQTSGTTTPVSRPPLNSLTLSPTEESIPTFPMKDQGGIEREKPRRKSRTGLQLFLPSLHGLQTVRLPRLTMPQPSPWILASTQQLRFTAVHQLRKLTMNDLLMFWMRFLVLYIILGCLRDVHQQKFWNKSNELRRLGVLSSRDEYWKVDWVDKMAYSLDQIMGVDRIALG